MSAPPVPSTPALGSSEHGTRMYIAAIEVTSPDTIVSAQSSYTSQSLEFVDTFPVAYCYGPSIQLKKDCQLDLTIDIDANEYGTPESHVTAVNPTHFKPLEHPETFSSYVQDTMHASVGYGISAAMSYGVDTTGCNFENLRCIKLEDIVFHDRGYYQLHVIFETKENINGVEFAYPLCEVVSATIEVS
ncbi:hypothetical protein F4677DRAFT_443026 [Hypoxylon crocopeplum]|nr:hypothetical protein F4677DRAFT_443026 [Hypoxylon crocopeplum]